jgi:hypothetical protein
MGVPPCIIIVLAAGFSLLASKQMSEDRGQKTDRLCFALQFFHLSSEARDRPVDL